MLKVDYNRNAMSFANTQGVHVLLVDSDVSSLASISRMLESFAYKVTVTQKGCAALSILSDSDSQVNLVLTEFRLLDVTSFTVLDEALKKDIPTILMSKSEDPTVRRMSLHHGACFFIQKPMCSHMAKDLWQFVGRAQFYKPKVEWNMNRFVEPKKYEGGSDSSETVSLDIPERVPKRQKKRMQRTSTAWTEELHAKFVDAVIQLGDGNCYPKEILETMNVPELTRMQVASHLQKCRDGVWHGPEDYRPFIREARLAYPGRLNGLRKFGSMPLSVKLQLSNPPTSRVADPDLRLGLGLPNAASSSKKVESDSPIGSSSTSKSVGFEFYKIMAKLGKANGSLKLGSPKKPGSA